MRLHFRAPMGTRIADTERLVLEAERKIREIIPAERARGPQRQHRHPALLQPGLRLHRQHRAAGRGDPHLAQAQSPPHRASTCSASARSCPRLFPGSSLYFQPADIVTQVLNFGLPAPIDVQIESERSEQGVRRGPAAGRRRCGASPGVVDVRIPQVLDYPSLQLDVDRQRAAQVGLSERDVANNLLTSLSQQLAGGAQLLAQPAEQRELHRGGADPAAPDAEHQRSAGHSDHHRRLAAPAADAHPGPHRRRRPTGCCLPRDLRPALAGQDAWPRSTTPPSSG